MVELKRTVLKRLTEYTEEQIRELRGKIEEGKNEISLTGDFGDLALAEGQMQELGILERLLSVYRKDLYVLKSTDGKVKEKVESGSLVKVLIEGKEMVYFFLPLLNHYEYRGIKTVSLTAPIYKALKGAKKGDEIEFNDKTIKVLEVV